MDQFFNVLVFGLLLGGIYALVSIGLNLIFGVVRIVNFAQGELVMFGMYGSYFAYAQFGIVLMFRCWSWRHWSACWGC